MDTKAATAALAAPPVQRELLPQPRKARMGLAQSFSIDPLTRTRLQHLKQVAAHHTGTRLQHLKQVMGTEHSTSSLVRRAVVFYGDHIDSLTTGLRTSKTREKAAWRLEGEGFYLKVAAAGAVVPFVVCPDGTGEMTWAEVIKAKASRRSVIEEAAADMAKRFASPAEIEL